MTSEDERSRVGVVGTGLIGTSIALAAIRTGSAVSGWDSDPGALEASAEGAGMESAASLEECVHGAGFVFVCTPVETIARTVRECLEADGAVVVSDVGSVKTKVVAEVEASAPSTARSRFVGGHPMGGSERTGPEGASASLIEGVAWVLTPAEWSDQAAVSALEGFLTGLGAHPVTMSPERHDRLVAAVSHLPQVASSALMALIAGDDIDDADALTLAGSGFRDVTRLAGSDPTLWAGILGANRGALIEAIDLYVERLLGFRDRVAGGRVDELREALASAQRARAELGAKPRVRAGMALLQVPIPDRPGILAHMTTALGEGGVNIEDLQIVHSPWEPSGIVHLAVLAERVDAALDVLRTGGFSAVRVA